MAEVRVVGNDISVFMAVVDFVPVVLFFAATVILMKDLYAKMYKGAYSLLATGSIMVLTAGFLKALWKALYALGICDWQALNQVFFPMQSIGFIFTFLSLFLSFGKISTRGKLLAAVPVFSSNLPFIIMQVIGCGGTQMTLLALAARKKKPVAVVMFVIAFVFMLAMGYLGAKFDNTSNMHWLAQCTNIVSNAAFLFGVVILHRNHLAD